MSDPTPPPTPPSPASPPPAGTAPLSYEAPNATAGVANAASLLLKVAAAAGAIGAVLRLITAVLPSGFGGIAVAGILGCLSFIILLVMVAGLVTYLVWQYRAYEVVRSAGQSTTYTPGWSVGWLIIPFANLIFSKTVFVDLWRASGATESPSPLAPADKAAGGRPLLVYFSLIGFFLLFVLGFFIAIIGAATGVAAIAVIGGLIVALSYVLWVVYAYALSLYVDDVQRALPAAPAPASPPAPPPAAPPAA